MEVVPCLDKKRRYPNLTEDLKRENCCKVKKVTRAPDGQIQKISAAERRGKWLEKGKKMRRTEKIEEKWKVLFGLPKTLVIASFERKSFEFFLAHRDKKEKNRNISCRHKRQTFLID